MDKIRQSVGISKRLLLKGVGGDKPWPCYLGISISPPSILPFIPLLLPSERSALECCCLSFRISSRTGHPAYPSSRSNPCMMILAGIWPLIVTLPRCCLQLLCSLVSFDPEHASRGDCSRSSVPRFGTCQHRRHGQTVFVRDLAVFCSLRSAAPYHPPFLPSHPRPSPPFSPTHSQLSLLKPFHFPPPSLSPPHLCQYTPH